eukprot:261556_1
MADQTQSEQPWTSQLDAVLDTARTNGVQIDEIIDHLYKSLNRVMNMKKIVKNKQTNKVQQKPINNQDYKSDDNDEKLHPIKHETRSRLIDETKNQMCINGHSMFAATKGCCTQCQNSYWTAAFAIENVKIVIEQINDRNLSACENKIVEYFSKSQKDEMITFTRKQFINEIAKYCENTKIRAKLGTLWTSIKKSMACAYCYDCFYYHWHDVLNETVPVNSIHQLYTICLKCRIKNAKCIKQEIKIEKLKSELIRKQLVAKPYLQLDLLCGLEKKASLDSLMKDIMRLDSKDRNKWIVLMIDLDNLKAINSILGHEGADGVIQDVADVLNGLKKGINDKTLLMETEAYRYLSRAFLFRTGGDEFIMILQSSRRAQEYGLKYFYSKLKTDVNALAAKHFKNIKHDYISISSETLKGRKKSKIFTAIGNAPISQQTRDDIVKSVDKEELKLNTKQISVSIGAYIPCDEPEQKNGFHLQIQKHLKHQKIQERIQFHFIGKPNKQWLLKGYVMIFCRMVVLMDGDDKINIHKQVKKN